MLIIFALTALATLCCLLFHLATLALPLIAGIAAAAFAHQSGAGLLGAGAVGLIAGATTLATGQFLFATTRATAARATIVLLFAAPAAIAGFSVVHGILVAGGANAVWATALSVAGGSVSAVVAVARLSDLDPRDPGGPSRTASRAEAAVGAPSRP